MDDVRTVRATAAVAGASGEAIGAALRLLYAHARSVGEVQRVEGLRAEAEVPGHGGVRLISRIRHEVAERWPRPTAHTTPARHTRSTTDPALAELAHLCADIEYAVRAIEVQRALPRQSLLTQARQESAGLNGLPSGIKTVADPGSEVRRRLAAEHEVAALVETVNAKLEGAALLRRTEALTYQLLHAHSISALQGSQPQPKQQPELEPEPEPDALECGAQSWPTDGAMTFVEEDSATSESEPELERTSVPQPGSAESIRAAEMAWSDGSREVVVGWPLEGTPTHQAAMAKAAAVRRRQDVTASGSMRNPLATRSLNNGTERDDSALDDEEFHAQMQELERLQSLLDDTDAEVDHPVLTTTEATDENEAAMSTSSRIGSHIPTAKSTRRRRKAKKAAAVVDGATAATSSTPPISSYSSDTLSVTTHQPGPIGIRWVPHSRSYEGSEERYGSGAKKLLRMRVSRITPDSVAATWQTAGLQPGMLLRAVSVAASPSSDNDADQPAKLIDVLDSGIGYDQALQMVKSTDRPLTLVFEIEQFLDNRQQALWHTDFARAKSSSAPAASPSASQKLHGAPGFGGWDATKAAIDAMADQASAAVSQATTSVVHSVSSSTRGVSEANSGSESFIATFETRETPERRVVELPDTAADAERTGSGRVVSDTTEVEDAAGTRLGTIVNVLLSQDGPLGISFEPHPNPRRRHCARIKHLIPGQQATAADQRGMLRPGLVLLRLGNQDMTHFHTYSAAIDFIRLTTKRPVALSFIAE